MVRFYGENSNQRAAAGSWFCSSKLSVLIFVKSISRAHFDHTILRVLLPFLRLWISQRRTANMLKRLLQTIVRPRSPFIQDQWKRVLHLLCAE